MAFGLSSLIRSYTWDLYLLLAGLRYFISDFFQGRAYSFDPASAKWLATASGASWEMISARDS